MGPGEAERSTGNASVDSRVVVRRVLRFLSDGWRIWGRIRRRIGGGIEGRIHGRLRGRLRDRGAAAPGPNAQHQRDRKSTRLNSSHITISYAVFCLKKKTR